MKTKLKNLFTILALISILITNNTVYVEATSIPTPTPDYEQMLDDLQTSYSQLQNNHDSLNLEYQNALTTITNLQEDLENEPVVLPKNPKIKLVDAPTIDVVIGRKEIVEITIKNIGSDYANTVLVQPTNSTTSPFTASLSETNFYSIASQFQKTIKLTIEVDKDAKPGSYELPIEYFYKDAENNNLSESDVITVRISTDNSAYSVSMHGFSNSLEKIEAGNEFTLTSKIENNSSKAVHDLQITIDGLASGEIHLDGTTQNLYFKTLSPSSTEEVSFNFLTHKDIQNGTYPLSFNIAYKDEVGESHTSSFYYYVNVTGETEEDEVIPADIKLENIVAPTHNLSVGENFDIMMNIINTSLTESTNIKISSLTGETDTTVIVPKSASIQQIPSLKSNESIPISFTFSATDLSKTRNYVIGFTVEYETGEKTDTGEKIKESFIQYVGVNVDNPEEDEDDSSQAENISKPKIIVSKYNIDPIIVEAGQNFDLFITFQNTHSVKSIENIKASLTSVTDSGSETQGNVFIPVDSSNTFYIDNIDPKQEVEKKFTFYTVPNASPQNYIVGIEFEYEDADHVTYTSTEQVGVNVKQVTKLETVNLTVPTEAFMYSPFYVYFDFYNTGKVTLSNLKIDVQGEFDTENSVSYYANFAPGSSNYYESTVIPTSPGTHTGTINITYEDDTGMEILETREFEFTVMEDFAMGGDFGAMGGEFDMNGDFGAMGGEFDMNGEYPSDQNSSSPNWYIIGGVAGVIVVVGVLKIRKKRKARLESMDIDE